MKNLFCVEIVGGKGALALLALRLAAGPAFILHGWLKIQNAFNWMGPDGFAPSWLQALAALAEFGGGIAILIGFLTQLGALGIACVMLVAIFRVHIPKGDPFVGQGSSWELAAVYLAIMIVLILRGPGLFSLDALTCGKRKG
ncbi:MAG: DoxX family protein [Candidatus Omnitrophica bacterium]|nr:DoxX family protein [Candidatus Omnitrophota bacterium]